ncbi:SRPBCC family protein [Ornithinimicrobium avium]|uniref:Carbon monoxide dehydrogenase n=1 Tax=Ornithinimicrobium avium TaxID=2283195 RepID=A0A345NPA1_9MICO|nr:carbon monoxide dehydrogenase subunit G [Ornithinimicrobium avium]AXH96859.1 carbon monoxide dehydrogenase [Ornithinimicrobium avium]
MQISGSNHLSADPATAWEAFHDESVLVATLPGAQAMREVAPGSFEMTVSAGVAAIRGTYDGTAVFSQEVPQESFVLSLAGAGGPGTINADVTVNMAAADDGGTDLTWTANATVGGPVGGVGQRMLSGVAKRLAGQFFANIDKELVRRASGEPELPTPTGELDPPTGDTVGPVPSGSQLPQAAGSPGRLGALRAAALPGAADGDDSFARGMAVGAAVALLGVLVGARARGRSR